MAITLWSSPAVVSSSTTGVQIGAGRSVVALPDGGYAAVWLSGNSVMLRAFSANGTPKGVEQTVNSALAYGEPSLLAFPDGRVLVAWAADNGLLTGRYVDSQGTPLGSESPLISFPTGAATRSKAALLSDGRHVVVAQSTQDGSGASVHLRGYEADGSEFGPTAQVNTTTTGDQRFASVAALANGAFAVVFQSDETGDGSGSNVRMRVYGAIDDPTDNDFILNTTTAGSQLEPDLVTLADGRLLAIWRSFEANEFRARLISSTGVPQGNDFQIAGFAGLPAGFPTIVPLANGQFIALYVDNASDVVAKLFQSDGTATGQELNITGATFANGSPTSGVELADGRIAVTWGQTTAGDFDRHIAVIDPRGDNFTIQKQGIATYASDAANNITGTPGVDTVFLMNGNDTLTAGLGNDIAYGGAGSDTFVLSSGRALVHQQTYNNGSGLIVTKTSGGIDGIDLMADFETIRYAGVDVVLNGAQGNRTGNVNGSRFDSVVFHNDSTGLSHVNVFNAGALTGSAPLTAALGAQWDAIDTADMNSDGIADIIYKNALDGSIQIGTSSAGGVTGYTALTTSLSTTWRLVGAADVDGDAYTDLIIQNNSNGNLFSADFTNLTFNSYKPISSEGTLWHARAVGDVNRDGRADIIYQNTVNGDVVAGLTTASSTISSYLSIAAVGNWTVKEAADINKDGYVDVLIQNNANGNISYANMAGGTFSGYGTVMNGFGTAWQLEGMADTNNDGDIDAVIRNVLGSSDTYVVNMESGAFQSFTLVAQGIGADWYVV